MPEISTNKQATTFLDIFCQAVERHSDSKALSWDETTAACLHTGKYFYTFQELENLANQFAGYLAQHAIKPCMNVLQNKINEPIVAIHCERNQPYWIISILAAWKAGAAVMLLDKALSKQECLDRINNVGYSCLITDNKNHSDDKKVILFNKALFASLSQFSITRNNHQPTADYLAYISHTSGTTSKEKAFAINHRGIVPVLKAHQQKMQITSSDKILQLAGFNFDACWMEFFLLATGANLVLCANPKTITGRLGAYIAKQKITIAILIPSIAASYNMHDPCFSSLKKIISTGEAASIYFLKQCLAADKKVWVGFGPGESTIGPTLDEYHGEETCHFTPNTGSDLFILNDTLAPTQATGQIAISGTGLMRGYVKNNTIDTESTNKVIIKNSINYYLTGDYGQYTVHGICFSGRKDRQVKIFGRRVELGFIEQAIERAICNANIAGINKVRIAPYFIEDNKTQSQYIGYLVAFLQYDNAVIITEETKIKLQQVLTQLRKTQNVYPQNYYLLPHKTLADKGLLSKNNKFSYQALDALANTPSFLTTLEPIAKFKNNRSTNSLEDNVLAIWCNILDYEPKAINITTDTFSQLKGDSHEYTYLLNCVKQQYNLTTLSSVKLLSGNFTVSDLALEVALTKVYQHAWGKINSQTQGPKVFCCPPVSGSSSEFRKNAFTQFQQYAMDDPALLLCKTNSALKQCLDYYKANANRLTIPQIAHYALQGIETIQSEGPYYLCGYSVGSKLAFEITLQLQAKQQKVAWLGLLDGAAPMTLINSLSNSNDGISDVIMVIQLIAEEVLKSKNLSFSLKLELDKNSQAEDKIKRVFIKAQEILQQRLNKPSSSNSTNTRPLQKLQNIYSIVEKNILALIAYQPKKPFISQNNVVLYYTKQTKSSAGGNLISDPTAWQPFLQGEFKEESINTTHLKLLESTEFRKSIALQLGREKEKMSGFHWPAYNHFKNFVGREPELVQLKRRFKPNGKPTTQVIHGFPGVGKTKLALEFIERCKQRQEYQTIILFTVGDNFKAELIDVLSTKLEVKNTTNKTMKSLIEDLYRKLASGQRVLIVFDDVEAQDEIEDYILHERSSNIDILITARQSDWANSDFNTMHLQEFSETESIAYIQKILPSMSNDDATRLAEAVYHYPLALSHVVTYCKKTKSTASKYIKALTDNAKKLMNSKRLLIKANHYKKTMMSAVKMQFDQLEKNEKLMLTLMSLLHHKQIPAIMLIAMYQNISNPSKEIEPLKLSDFELIILSLQELSFIGVSKDMDFFVMHGMVHKTLREMQANETIANILHQMFAKTILPNFTKFDKNLTFLYGICGIQVLFLLKNTLIYKTNLNDNILNLWTSSMDFDRSILYHRHHDAYRKLTTSVFATLDNAAYNLPGITNKAIVCFLLEYAALIKLSDLEISLYLFAKAVEIAKDDAIKWYAKFHYARAGEYCYLNARNPKTMELVTSQLTELIELNPKEAGTYYHELGYFYTATGVEYKKAHSYYQKALAEKQKIQASEEQLAVTYQALSNTGAILGKLQEAKNASEKAMQLKKEWFGFISHPHVAISTANMVVIYIRCGMYLQAEELLNSPGVENYVCYLYQAKLAINLEKLVLANNLLLKFKKTSKGKTINELSNILISTLYYGRLMFANNSLETSLSELTFSAQQFNILNKKKPSHNMVIALLYLAETLIGLKSYEKAKDKINQIFSNTKHVYIDENNPTSAHTFYLQSVIEYKENKISLSKQHADKSLRIYNTITGTLPNAEKAKVFRHLGILAMYKKEFVVAKKYLDNAFTIQLLSYGRKNHSEVLQTNWVYSLLLSKVAIYYYNKGDVINTLYYNKLAKKYCSRHVPCHNYAAVLSANSIISRNEAEQAFKQGIKLSSSSGILIAYAHFLLSYNEPAKSLHYAKLAITCKDNNRLCYGKIECSLLDNFLLSLQHDAGGELKLSAKTLAFYLAIKATLMLNAPYQKNILLKKLRAHCDANKDDPYANIFYREAMVTPIKMNNKTEFFKPTESLQAGTLFVPVKYQHKTLRQLKESLKSKKNILSALFLSHHNKAGLLIDFDKNRKELEESYQNDNIHRKQTDTPKSG